MADFVREGTFNRNVPSFLQRVKCNLKDDCYADEVIGGGKCHGVYCGDY
jgi:hypothetical protein